MQANMKAILLERGLVALATVIVAGVVMNALADMEAGDLATFEAILPMTVVYVILLVAHGIGDRQLQKLRKAAGDPGLRWWEVAILTVLLLGAVAFAWQFGGAVSVAIFAGLAVIGLCISYRDLRRLQAAGHIQ